MIYAPDVPYDIICTWEMLETTSIPILRRIDESIMACLRKGILYSH